MVKGQIYLKDKQLKIQEKAAKERNVTISEVMRDIVDEKFKVEPAKSSGQILISIAEMAERLNLTGPSDMSTNLDAYLYGDKS